MKEFVCRISLGNFETEIVAEIFPAERLLLRFPEIAEKRFGSNKNEVWVGFGDFVIAEIAVVVGY